MADSKKYDGSQWEHSLRKLTTATDTLTTLPADIYADGTNATVGLKGNTVQNGTLTPSNPVEVQGVGVRTENLVEKRIDGCNISSSGVLNSNASWNIFVAKIEQGKTYSVDTPTYAAFYELTPIVGSSSYDGQRYSVESSFTSPIDGYVAFRKIASELTAMCNEGSTALPYEPYGYKIPISSANATTPVYLGEVESTRRVKKQVVTISRIIESETPNMKIAIVALDTSLVSPRTALSTVVPYGNAIKPETFYYVNANNIGMVGAVGDTDEQITAKYEGSILYYGIAETTGIVNEPLMRIGDYADTVSGISIPTIDGANTISVDTTVQPSEFTATWTGWHDASVKEWDGSQWD